MKRHVPIVVGPAGVICVAIASAWVAGPSLWGRPQPVLAASSMADESFAVCTTLVDVGVEGFFMLDFETGDLSGGILNPVTQKFGIAYRHNVLKDLNFKASKAKSPKFLLVAGELLFGGPAAANLAPSVLYVTDGATGVTVAYGIPRMGPAGAQRPLVPLDIANARGGGTRVP